MAAAAVVLLLLLHSVVLTALGSYLVKAEEPQKADIAVVLAGDFAGNRILKAASLVRDGYAPKAMVSGPPAYGVYESDLAIPFAVRAGFPETYFLNFKHHARSTMEEAGAITPELRRMGVKRVLLVTSNYHTRRAGRIFKAVAPDLTFVVVAAGDPDFEPDRWWKNREGRKTFVIEWMKTVAEWGRL